MIIPFRLTHEGTVVQMAKVFQDAVINYLEITRCGLNVLHSSLGNAARLTKLVLHSNELKILPESIGELKELQFLDFSTNKLRSLPASVGRLSRLTTLLLSHNEAIFFFSSVITRMYTYYVNTVGTNDFAVESVWSKYFLISKLRLRK